MEPQSVTLIFEAAAAAFAALRLFHFSLHSPQKAMFTYLAGTSLYLFVLGALNTSSHAYFWTWTATLILGWGMAVFAVREIFFVALKNYPGLRSAARRAMSLSLTLAVIISLALARFTWTGQAGRSNLYFIQTVNKSVVLTLSAFIVLFLLLLSRYPLRLRSNTLVSCGCFCAVFLSEGVVMLIDTVQPDLYSVVADTTQNLFAGLCYTVWAVLLRPDSPDEPKRQGGKQREVMLLRELDALNELVGGVSRR